MNGVCRRLSYQLITLENSSPNKWEKIFLPAEYLQAMHLLPVLIYALRYN